MINPLKGFYVVWMYVFVFYCVTKLKEHIILLMENKESYQVRKHVWGFASPPYDYGPDWDIKDRIRVETCTPAIWSTIWYNIIVAVKENGRPLAWIKFSFNKAYKRDSRDGRSKRSIQRSQWKMLSYVSIF